MFKEDTNEMSFLSSNALYCGCWRFRTRRWQCYPRHDDKYHTGPAEGSFGHTKLSTNSFHYNDVIMEAIASQITSLSIVYSTVCSGTDKKRQSSPSLAFVSEIHRWQVNSPHNGPVTLKMLPFDNVVIMLKFKHATLLTKHWLNHFCKASYVSRKPNIPVSI